MSHQISLRKVSKGNFSIIPNDLARDALLTFRATGLFVYLWSLPQSYKFSIESLSNKKAKGGRDAIKRMVKELQETGYLQITRFRGTDGRFKRVIWTLTDDPARPSDGGIREPVHKTENLLEVAKSSTSSISHMRESPQADNTSRKDKDCSVIKTTTRPAPHSAPEQARAAQSESKPAPQVDAVAAPTLIAPSRLSATDGQAAVQFVIERLGSSDLAQEVLDELDGKIAQQRIRGDWQSYLHGLVKRAQDGEFVPAAGRQVGKGRQPVVQEWKHQLAIRKSDPIRTQQHFADIKRILK